MEIAPLTFSPEMAGSIATKAQRALKKIASLVEPLTSSAKRHQYVLDEVNQAEAEARAASGNPVEFTKAWTRSAAEAAELTLVQRSAAAVDEINQVLALATELQACIAHLANPEQTWSTTVQPATKCVFALLKEHFESRQGMHTSSPAAEALRFLAAHPATIFRTPNSSELSRFAREVEIQASVRRDPSHENVRRLMDRHDLPSTKETKRIGDRKRAA